MIKYEDGTSATKGDLIRWNCWDDEDYCLYSFTGAYLGGGIIKYLSGGIDFGGGLGNIVSVEEVLEEAKNNDEGLNTILKVGRLKELISFINGLEVL